MNDIDWRTVFGVLRVGLVSGSPLGGVLALTAGVGAPLIALAALMWGGMSLLGGGLTLAASILFDKPSQHKGEKKEQTTGLQKKENIPQVTKYMSLEVNLG